MGTGLGKVEGIGTGLIGPNVLYRNVHTGLNRGSNQDPLFPIVPVQFSVPVPVPFPCSVNKPQGSLKDCPKFKASFTRIVNVTVFVSGTFRVNSTIGLH